MPGPSKRLALYLSPAELALARAAADLEGLSLREWAQAALRARAMAAVTAAGLAHDAARRDRVG